MGVNADVSFDARSSLNNPDVTTDVLSHSNPIIQELKRRYDALDAKMGVLKAETQNGG